MEFRWRDSYEHTKLYCDDEYCAYVNTKIECEKGGYEVSIWLTDVTKATYYVAELQRAKDFCVREVIKILYKKTNLLYQPSFVEIPCG